MTRAEQYSNDETPFDPTMRLAQIQDFLIATSQLLVQQTVWLAYMEGFVSPQTYDEDYAAFRKVRSDNLDAAQTELRSVKLQTGRYLTISNPETGSVAELAGIGYDEDSLRYIAQVKLGTATDMWDISEASRLSLGTWRR